MLSWLRTTTGIAVAQGPAIWVDPAPAPRLPPRVNLRHLPFSRTISHHASTDRIKLCFTLQATHISTQCSVQMAPLAQWYRLLFLGTKGPKFNPGLWKAFLVTPTHSQLAKRILVPQMLTYLPDYKLDYLFAA